MQGSHDALVQLSGTLRTLAVSLYKIANDIRLLSSGPRAGFAELQIPANEPGSSIMPGKVNPTQVEALTMIAVQVMANDVAVGFGGAGGYLEMNVYKPLMIHNVMQSITLLTDGCTNFRQYLVEGTKPNRKRIAEYVDRSLMLVTALSPVIGYDKAAHLAHYAMEHDLTLKEAALQLGYVSEEEFDRVVDPSKNAGADAFHKEKLACTLITAGFAEAHLAETCLRRWPWWLIISLYFVCCSGLRIGFIWLAVFFRISCILLMRSCCESEVSERNDSICCDSFSRIGLICVC